MATCTEANSEEPKKKVPKQKKKMKSRSIMKERIEHTREGVQIDGALHIPHHYVLIHLLTGVPSMHALGDQRQLNKSGLYHVCVDPQTAASITMEQFNTAKKKQKSSDPMNLPALSQTQLESNIIEKHGGQKLLSIDLPSQRSTSIPKRVIFYNHLSLNCHLDMIVMGF
eukprot:5914943-Ditylum_brightwellii.AAC.1